MVIKQGIVKFFLLILTTLASVTNTLAEPIFKVYSNTNRASNGNYYLCDQHNTGDIHIMAANGEAEKIGKINVEIYASATDMGDKTKAIAVYTNQYPSDIEYTVERSSINPTNQKKLSQSYYVSVSPADGSAGSWSEVLTFDAIHVNDVTINEIEPYCAGNMPSSVTSIISKYSSSKYHWHDKQGNALGLGDFLTVSKLPEGNYVYYLQVKEDNCYSLGATVTLPIMGNSAPSLNKTYVTYTPSDISGNSYSKTIYEQAKALYGSELVDNPNDCDLIWKDKDGNVIPNFHNYIPDIPTTYGTNIDQFTVQKNCGCGSISKSATLYLFRYVVPKPTVEDFEFCINDPRAANGFDIKIGMTTEAGEAESNYTVEFSKNPDMSDAIVLPAGSTHADYAFDVNATGTTTYYIRQQRILNGEYSSIVSFDVVVKQPSTPILKDLKICANSTQSILLNTICGEDGIIWKDADDNVITDKISTENRGDIIVSAQKSETVDGKQCYSEISTATIHVDSLDISISGDDILLPEETGSAGLTIKGSGNQTVIWSSNINSSIVGDANKNDVTVKMNKSDVTLTATVTDGACSKSANWTIQADLFQCPRPTADNIELCINDPRATDGFDANITLENNADSKSNYTLSISKNADMSGATTLPAGETHFDYKLDASTVGTKTLYIQQTELSRNMSSAIVPVTVNVNQPKTPSLFSAAICLNVDTEIKLTDINKATNLQWYDEDKKELTTTAKFNKKGTHYLYAKQYEMVNGEKCWSELASTTVNTDSIGIKIEGDQHLCPNSEGAVSIVGTFASFIKIQWESDIPNTISNASSPTVKVTMSDKDLNLKYTVLSGVCETSGSWGITVGTGKVSGNIKFTEGEKVRSFPNLTNTEFNSCGETISVEATIEHTSSDFTVIKDNKEIGTYSFSGDVAKFEIEGAGTYSVIFANDCETSFSFKITEEKIQPNVVTTKWSSCYNGYISAEISNADGCNVVWKRDGTEIDSKSKILKINNVSADNIGNYTYELVCDGCPFNGVVSTKQPDIYAPLEVSVIKSADTICQGKGMNVELHISPNSDKVTYVWPTDYNIQISNNGASATLSPYTTQSVSVIIKNGDCPQQTKTINVVVQPQMTGGINAGNIMCEGDSTILDASSLDAEKYIWGHTDKDSPIITVVPTGVENKYTLTAVKEYCTIEKEFILMVGATPELASIDSVGLDDVEINMETAGDYLYIVDNKDNAEDIANNVKKHVGFGKHTLSIVDKAGCKTDTSFTVVEPPFEIQKFIVPNSDGKDAYFRIPDAVIVYPGTTMNIFDRWGKKLVTLTSSDEEGWDGTYNGNPMPSSDYWYELNVDAIDKVYVGHFTLIRE